MLKSEENESHERPFDRKDAIAYGIIITIGIAMVIGIFALLIAMFGLYGTVIIALLFGGFGLVYFALDWANKTLDRK